MIWLFIFKQYRRKPGVIKLGAAQQQILCNRRDRDGIANQMEAIHMILPDPETQCIQDDILIDFFIKKQLHHALHLVFMKLPDKCFPLDISPWRAAVGCLWRKITARHISPAVYSSGRFCHLWFNLIDFFALPF